jgi:hypothetical protein
VDERADRSQILLGLRLALAGFVLLWILGPYELRSAIPVWLPFVIALGLEVQFVLGALRPQRGTRRNRGPQEIDRELYGDPERGDELLLVREGDEELWIPYAGETGEELEELIAAERERVEEPAPVPAAARSGPVRRFGTGLAVIAALALVIWFAERHSGWRSLSPDTRAEAAARFSTEASRIAGKPVTIRCDESGDYVGAVQHADGVATVGGDLAFLTPERCLDLYRLVFKDQVRSSQTGRAIAVLAHESWHLRGVRDEGTTECYALQSGVALGERLGLGEGTARQLMRQQLVENGLRGAGDAEYIVSPECRNGGRLDLHPRSSDFP